jgi:hypothetical protein
VALARLETDDADAALTALEAAIERNESFPKIISDDPDLQSLRDKPRYQALIKTPDAI